MRTLMRCSLMVCALIGLSALAGEPKEVDTNFGNLTTFTTVIAAADKTELYEGIPRDDSGQTPRKGKKISLHDYTFYEEKPALGEKDAEKLKMLFCAEGTFHKWIGEKKCGGFHPDFCIEWHKGADVFQVLLCFGCEEVKCFGPKVELRCDISSEAFKKFSEILNAYLPLSKK